MELWYKKPAAYWEEALPLGNGRLGAMVWSGVEQEKISLNEDSLWSGYPQSHDIPGAEKYYEEARRLAREKKYCEAQVLIEENVLGQYTQSYLPLGELILDMVHPEGEVSDYRRWLDLEKAMCGLRYSVGNVSYAREAFVSAPDQVMVMRISADKAGKVSLRAGYTCQLRATVSAEGGCMVLDGIAPSQVDPSYVNSEDPVIYEEDPKKKGMRFCAMLTIRQKGGTVRQLPEGLEVAGADSVTLYLAARTSFNGPFRQPFLEGKPYRENCLKDLRAVGESGYDALAARHVEDYRVYFDRVRIDLGAGREDFNSSLQFLSQCLEKAYGRRAVILIDEYDVPLENAYFAGFYGEMTSFIRSLFDSALKTNLSLEFAVVTGCLRITRESIFTGLNNLNMISVLSDLYAEYFGFTQKEVDEALRFYGREGKREVMKRWYDGYRFGSAEVYNPWSVIKYIQDIAENENYLPRPYWANTSSNNIVKTLVEKADISVKEEIEKLIGGGAVEKAVHEEVTYGDMDGNQDNLWNFLFFTGYLKKVEERIEGRTIRLKLAIPNEEVRYIYENTIINWFRERIKKEDLSLLYRSLEEGDCQAAGEIIASHLAGTISFYDYAENFYHGFMLGMLSQADRYIVRSNRESGNGRYDIVMKTPSRRGLAILIELKAALSMDDLEKACQRGLSQIEEMGYGRELQEDGYRNIKRYAVAFYKKDCEVMGG